MPAVAFLRTTLLIVLVAPIGVVEAEEVVPTSLREPLAKFALKDGRYKAPEVLYRAVIADSSGNTFLVDGLDGTIKTSVHLSKLEQGLLDKGFLPGKDLVKERIIAAPSKNNMAILPAEDSETGSNLPARILQYVAGGPASNQGYPRDSNFVGLTSSPEVAVVTACSTGKALLGKEGSKLLLYQIKREKLDPARLVSAEQVVTMMVHGRLTPLPNKFQAKRLQGHYWPRGEFLYLGAVPNEALAGNPSVMPGPDVLQDQESLGDLKKAVAEYKSPAGEHMADLNKKGRVNPLNDKEIIPFEHDVVVALKRLVKGKAP